MGSRRPLFALASALVAIGSARGQFLLSVQQNNQAFTIGNGGTLTVNAPAIGQTATAVLTLTYLGSGTVSFPAGAKLTGPSSFAVKGSPGSLSLFQSATLNFSYTPTDTAQAAAQFFLPFTETGPPGPAGTTAATSNGAFALNLAGTTPNIVVGSTPANGGFLPVPPGGAFQLPETLVNVTSSVTVAIANVGSGPATINSIVVNGNGFVLQGVPLLPLTLNAGAQLSVTVQLLPTIPGTATGSLQIAYSGGSYTASLSGTAFTSFLLYHVTQADNTSAVTPGQTIFFPDTKVGTSSSLVVQFQNVGSVARVLNTATLSGAGFSVSDGPFLPLTLQPQESASLTITYTPTQPITSTGRLIIGADTFTLSARGLGPLLSFSWQGGGSSVTASPGDTISFPPANGQAAIIQFTITNSGTSAGSLFTIGIVDPKASFQIGNLPNLPLQLDPGASASFSIAFSPPPQTTGFITATLVVNNLSFTLSGFATPTVSALPSYRFTGASGVQQPFQQPAIGLTLTSTYPKDLAGVLNLTFAANNFTTDPAIQFSSGGRQVPFLIPANTLQAVFPNGSSQIRFQTGTDAGTIQIAPTFTVGDANGPNITPVNPAILQITVPSLAPALLTASLASRSATGFSIQITGYSTSRSLDHFSFRITPASGAGVGTLTGNVDTSAAAKIWYLSAASQSLGSQFAVEIPFTLGSADSLTPGTDLTRSIASISITASNEIGVSNSLQVLLP